MIEENQPAELPATFEDLAGRAWPLRIDFVALKLIRAQTRIDLGDLATLGKAWAEILYSDEKALRVLWLVISRGQETTASSSLGEDDWLAAMDGVVLERARDALREAVENFTPPLKRPMLRRGMGAVHEVYRRMIQEAEQRVAEATSPAIEKALAQFRRGMPAPIAPESSAGSTMSGR